MFGLINRKGMAHLVVAHSCLNDSSPKASRNANRYATNHAAHKDIPQHALLSISKNIISSLSFWRQEQEKN